MKQMQIRAKQDQEYLELLLAEKANRPVLQQLLVSRQKEASDPFRSKKQVKFSDFLILILAIKFLDCFSVKIMELFSRSIMLNSTSASSLTK